MKKKNIIFQCNGEFILLNYNIDNVFKAQLILLAFLRIAMLLNTLQKALEKFHQSYLYQD